VGGEDDVGARELVDECLAALLAELRVTHGHDLVDEVHVEIEGHAQAEGEPRAHARRVRLHRQLEVVADLGELAHVVDLAAHLAAPGTVDAADELAILAPAEVGVQPAGQANGEGDARVGDDLAAVRGVDAAQQPQQRGLAGTVAADEADVGLRREAEVEVAEHVAPPQERRVGLGQAADFEHG
jgi:hypothetical protein